MVKGMESLTASLRDYLTVPLSAKMHEEQLSMNVLVGRILELKEGNTDRIKLMKELTANYPELMEGINAETVSNKELAIRLEEVNEQLVNRIAIQREQ